MCSASAAPRHAAWTATPAPRSARSAGATWPGPKRRRRHRTARLPHHRRRRPEHLKQSMNLLRNDSQSLMLELAETELLVLRVCLREAFATLDKHEFPLRVGVVSTEPRIGVTGASSTSSWPRWAAPRRKPASTRAARHSRCWRAGAKGSPDALIALSKASAVELDKVNNHALRDDWRQFDHHRNPASTRLEGEWGWQDERPTAVPRLVHQEPHRSNPPQSAGAGVPRKQRPCSKSRWNATSQTVVP